jgi:hypothetical protein
MIRQSLRILLNALTVLSLVLAVLVAGLWVRSYSHRYQLERSAFPKSTAYVNSDYGAIESAVMIWIPRAAARDASWGLYQGEARERSSYDTSHPYSHSFAGFRVGHRTSSNAEIFGVQLPHWALLLTSLSLPAARLRVLRIRRGASSRGLCPSCGYDLRATPERCPECGAVPVQPIE